MKQKTTTTIQLAGLLMIVALAVSACTGTPTPNLEPTTVATQPPAPVSPTATSGPGDPAYPAPTDPQPGADPSYPAPPDEGGVPPAESAYPAPDQPAVAIPANNVAALPDPAGYTWQTVFSGLTKPTDLIGLGDGSGRLLVLDQPGVIYLVDNGQLQPTPFLDIRDRVGSSATEQGLLGITLHPDFANNGYFYVNYTRQDGTTAIVRFTAAPERTNASADSEKVLLTQAQPAENHNAGQLAFGPDGYLYFGLGDGGSGEETRTNGQNPEVLLGKLLRIDVNNGDPYAIPAENVFANGGGAAEIYALGLRNPWRFSFDRATGDLYLADVGRNVWEEVNFLPAGTPAGVNFGWNYREGANPHEGNPPADLVMTDPVAQYDHPTGCSITGGYVYRGEALPDFQGVYLYGDYCTGRIWGLLRLADGSWQNQVLFETGLNISSFGQDDAGELYLLDHSSGSVLKLVKR
ncbi:MAG: PQQ-dependent sugar dehydrogenase [Anaerolineaceae bacterium]|nr:PQQ-dependent sugar dehydrogenase [Anaerolineaceae bacterium]